MKTHTRARASIAGEPPSRSSTHTVNAVDDDARPIRCQGQRLLRELPGSLAQIGAAVSVTKQCVSKWREGLSVPDERSRRALASMYGIPFGAWQPYRDNDNDDDPTDDEDDDAGEDDDDTDRPEPSVMDDCVRLLRVLRRELDHGKLTARERSQLSADFSRALAQKARLEKDRELLEQRVIREHPGWRRLRGVIIEALLPHPQAARDVEAAIRRALDDDGATFSESDD